MISISSRRDEKTTRKVKIIPIENRRDQFKYLFYTFIMVLTIVMSVPATTTHQSILSIHGYKSFNARLLHNAIVFRIYRRFTSIYLPIRLNPRGGHQTGSSEPSAGGYLFNYFIFYFFLSFFFVCNVSCVSSE